jgi:nucleotide-binding universal stress UspA family protein
MKILVCHDGSEVSLRAIHFLIEHVKWFRDPPELHLLYVHPPIPIGLATKHVAQATLDAYYREEGEEALRGARAALAARGLAYTAHIHVGPVPETIVRVARDLGCELICLGTHGRGILGNALMGSVATKVLHLSAIPVMLAR